MAFTLADLVALLDLAADGPDRFLGLSPDLGRGRIFGGLVIAQALVAMGRTSAARPVHSLHGYFMLPGDPAAPIAYGVERMRDGGSFSTRRCVAHQHGRPIFAMSASFHAAEPDALDHAIDALDVPPPEALPSAADIAAGRAGALPPAVRDYFGRDSSVELRPVDLGRFSAKPPLARPPRQAIWMRATAPLPDDPALHAAVLAYMSDLTLLDTALVSHGRSVFDPDVQAASLDHALWFHRPLRVDDWLLYAEDSPSASGSLGFARGSVFDRAGRLVASVAQEGLIRLRRPPDATSAGTA